MFTFDLHAKLRRLNKGLYINTNQLTVFTNGEKALGVLRRVNKRKEVTSSAKLSESDSATHRFLTEEAQGVKDEFLFAVPYPYVPEYDEIDNQTGRVLKKGWRSIALQLVSKNVCTLSRARHIFQCPSLGETDYDKLGYTGKLRMTRAKH